MDFRIAICDDELSICSQLENMIIEILQDMQAGFEIEIFSSGEVLCHELKRQNFDIIFLDIELPRISGIDVGKYIRDELKNEIVQIVYISSKERYAMELFEFRPINFLVKPLEKENISKVLKKYFTITEQNNHLFQYKKRTEFFRIPMSEILYFENDKRKIKIRTLNSTDEFYESMENIYSMVKRHDFLFIHKSFIVNYRFIKRISYEEVIMTDDSTFPISQSRRKAIKQMYMNIKMREL